MWLCEGKLKVKTAHFQLPSASQKRACLSSLLYCDVEVASLISLVVSRGLLAIQPTCCIFNSDDDDKDKLDSNNLNLS